MPDKKRLKSWKMFASKGCKFEFCWFHGSRIISAASDLVFWTFLRAKTCCVVCHSYCFCYSATNMARKMSKKLCSIRLLRWSDFSQSENRKNNRRTFEGASVEPTNYSALCINYYTIPKESPIPESLIPGEDVLSWWVLIGTGNVPYQECTSSTGMHKNYTRQSE